MREILFRGKRVDNGEMVEGDLVHEENCFNIITEWYCEKECIKAFGVEVLPETVGQYTGLTDKKGNKIFEGDLIDYWEDKKETIKQRLQVFFENGQFVVDHYAINLLNSRNMRSEVIGNIYEEGAK